MKGFEYAGINEMPEPYCISAIEAYTQLLAVLDNVVDAQFTKDGKNTSIRIEIEEPDN